MNIVQRYIGIIKYQVKFPFLSGRYIIKLNNDIYNLNFDGNVRSVDYYYKLAMNGRKESDEKKLNEKKSNEMCWVMLLIDKESKELERGSIQTLSDKGIINELNFCSPKEVNRTYRTYVDDNDNMICKYDYDFEKFKVPFEIEKVD